MKMYGWRGVDVYMQVLLILALVGGEWSGPSPGRFTPPMEEASVLIV
jgi:hypothetical protein